MKTIKKLTSRITMITAVFVAIGLSSCSIFDGNDDDGPADCKQCTASSNGSVIMTVRACTAQEESDFISGYNGFNPVCN